MGESAQRLDYLEHWHPSCDHDLAGGLPYQSSLTNVDDLPEGLAAMEIYPVALEAGIVSDAPLL